MFDPGDFEGSVPSVLGSRVPESDSILLQVSADTRKERIPCPISIIRQTKSHHAVNLCT